MFKEVRAEITQLVHNIVFVRNLSITLFAAIVIFSSLAELQSQNSSVKGSAIANNSNSSSMKIIMKRR